MGPYVLSLAMCLFVELVRPLVVFVVVVFVVLVLVLARLIID
jgi:hypothetical protein